MLKWVEETMLGGSLGGSHKARGANPLLGGLGTVVGLRTFRCCPCLDVACGVAVLRSVSGETLRSKVQLEGKAEVPRDSSSVRY
jgi:hypothetical protein